MKKLLKKAVSQKNLRQKILQRALVLFCLLILLLLQTSGQKNNPGEAMFRGNPQHTGVYNTDNKNVAISPKWEKLKIGENNFSSPIISDGTIFMASRYGNVYALDIKTGNQKWTFATDGEILSSPAIAGNNLFFGSHDGNFYALRKTDGSKKWTFQIKDYKYIDSSPAVVDGTVYFGDFNNNLHAIDIATGQEKWKFKTGDIVSSSPAVVKGIVYFGSYDHYFYALDAQTGKEKWKFKTGDSIFSSPLVVAGVVYFGSHDKNLYALDALTGREKWHFACDWIHSSPAYTQGTIYFGAGDRNFYAVDAQTGQVKWKFKTNGMIISSPAIEGNLVYFGSFDGNFYALDGASGQEKWRFGTKGPIESSAAVMNGTAYFTGTDGYLYAVNDKTKNNGAVVSENSHQVGAYDLYELTINFNQEGINNPWEDAAIFAEFHSLDDKVIKIDGFYHSIDTWKVRFAPPKEGTWWWTLSFKTPMYELSDAGSFLVQKSDNPGFIQKNYANSFRLLFSNGQLFNGLGLNESLIDMEHGGSPFDNLGLDGEKATLDEYLKAYGDKGAGFNLYRWSIDNANFKLWKVVEPTGNWYALNEGWFGDELAFALKDNGFGLWLTFFGMDVPYGTGFKPDQLEAVKRYIKYVVARYGAFVDIWELANEAKPSDEWINEIAAYLRSLDPYGRLISTSWERQELGIIDIISPHWYENEPEENSDLVTAQKIEEAKKAGKPVIFGEQGNKYSNWDDKSALRMRLRSWTAFFKEAVIIFWNTSSLKNFVPEREGANGNIYLGAEERGYVRVLQDFTAKADADVKQTEMTPEADGIRAYGLQSSAQILGYFHHFSDHVNEVTTSFTLNLPVKGKATWLDPASGKILDSYDLDSGQQTLTTPKFVVDLALRIEMQ